MVQFHPPALDFSREEIVMKEFVQYKRDKNGVPIGCVVGHVMPSTGEVYYGWSLCHKSDRKQLSKKFAKQVARDRVRRHALEWHMTDAHNRPRAGFMPSRLPFSLVKTYEGVASRIQNYMDKNGL